MPRTRRRRLRRTRKAVEKTASPFSFGAWSGPPVGVSVTQAISDLIQILNTLVPRDMQMAPIPTAVQILKLGSPEQLQLLLKAALIRLSEEDVQLIVSPEDLQAAAGYSLITTVEGEAIILTVRPR